MRKLWIIAAFAAIALTSCQQEKDIPGSTLGKNGVAFKIEGAATRSSDAAAPGTEVVASIPFATVGGLKLTLEERSRQELRPLPVADGGALGLPGTRQMLRRESPGPDIRAGRGWRGAADPGPQPCSALCPLPSALCPPPQPWLPV